MKQKIMSLFLIVIILVSFSGCQAKQDVIVLGFVGVLTGPVAMNGELSSRGAILAVEEINRDGGVLARGVRRPLKLVLEDDQGQPEPSIKAVNKLIEEDKAFAILGPEFANAVLAVLPIIQEHKVIQFYSTNSPVVTNGKFPNSFSFRSRVDDTLLVDAVIHHINNDLGGAQREVGIAYNTTEYGKTGSSLLQEGLAEYGIKIAANVSHNHGDKDLTSSAVTIINNGADVVVTWTGPAESLLLLRTLRILGWKGEFIHGNPDSIFAAISQSEGEGVFGPQGWAPTDTSSKSQSFVKAYKARFNQLPDNHSAAYYDAVYLLKAAIEAVGELDVEKIHDYIGKLNNWPGVQGTFHPADFQNGNMLSATVLVQIQNGELKIVRQISQ